MSRVNMRKCSYLLLLEQQWRPDTSDWSSDLTPGILALVTPTFHHCYWSLVSSSQRYQPISPVHLNPDTHPYLVISTPCDNHSVLANLDCVFQACNNRLNVHRTLLLLTHHAVVTSSNYISQSLLISAILMTLSSSLISARISWWSHACKCCCKSQHSPDFLRDQN